MPTESLPRTGRETGIDVGLQVFLITAEGEQVEHPRHYRKTAEATRQGPTARLSPQEGQQASQEGGATAGPATAERCSANGTDFHHKTALDLLRTYDAIYLEDVPVRTMVRNRHLATSIGDAGWAAFRTILTSQPQTLAQPDAGQWVVAVSPAFTSQDCSGCGGCGGCSGVPKSLAVRTHVCPTCGLVWTAMRTRRATCSGPGRPVRERWRWPPRELRSPRLSPWGVSMRERC